MNRPVLALTLAATFALPGVALADSPSALPAGQPVQFSLAAANGGCDGAQLLRFDYPGDNSTVTVDAKLTGYDPNNVLTLGLAGINVWDAEAGAMGRPIAGDISKNNDPTQLEVNYSSSRAGSVTLELFNWTPSPVTAAVTPVAVSGNGLQVVSTKPAGAC